MLQSISIRTLSAIAAMFVCSIAPASAQTEEPPPSVEQHIPNPDPSQPAPPTPIPVVPSERFTTAEATALLATWQATEQFEVVTLEEGKVGLRHRGSGMVCRFATDRENRINVRRPGQENSDVGCVSGPWPQTMLAAARNNFPIEMFIEEFERNFRQEHPNARAFEANQLWPPERQGARYLHLVSQNAVGERSVIHAVVFRQGRWTIMSRMTYSASGDLPVMAAELAAASYFSTIFSDLDD